MPRERKLRIAQVGCGSRGLGVRLPAIRMMSDVFDLAAVCDVDEGKARSVGAEFGVRAYSRVQDLAANEDLDVAAVSTPGDSHHAVGAYLAERGVNLIVETPISPTLQTTDVLIRAVERGGVKLEVAEQFCREPMHLMKRRAIEAGAIGDVTAGIFPLSDRRLSHREQRPGNGLRFQGRARHGPCDEFADSPGKCK